MTVGIRPIISIHFDIGAINHLVTSKAKISMILAKLLSSKTSIIS